ncbi:MAG: TIGR04211 family SH3 domain-containing protein [Gammaproteobacteria bacterium]|nr:TIGR04211 family SH3 domain-containing protein [Gammaproteobacteria bacterium]
MSRIALLCGLLVTAVAYSETRYVSDQLTLNLRDAPSSEAAVLPPSLTSGDVVEVLRRDADSAFLEVVTENGRQGWVHGQYLVATPIARDRLQAAEERIVALEGTIAEQRAALEAGAGGEPSDAPADEALKAQIDRLGQQIEDLEGILAQSDLRRTDSTPGMIRTLRDYWPVLGFGFFVLGIVIGLIIRFRPKRSAWS